MLLIKSLLILCTATAVLASDSFDAVSSVGYFGGGDDSDLDATGLPVFTERKNRGSATATIVQHCADFTDLKPSQMGVNIPSWSYDYFVHKLDVFTPLEKTFSVVKKLELIGSVKHFVRQIERTYYDFDKEDGYPFDRQVIKNFGDLVPWKLDHPKQNRWLLNQVAIRKASNSDDYRIELVRVTLQMSEDPRTGRARIDAQDATFSRDVYTVDFDWITEHAELMADELDTANLAQATLFLTTKVPDNDGPFDQQESFCEEPEKKLHEFYGRSRFHLQ
ncbi:hypothetical protein EC968_009954 [Mortierella alpina]|nr:hypothetical protein EC968_009954 [Mortierella alpina]